jgi:hypothetical protein
MQQGRLVAVPERVQVRHVWEQAGAGPHGFSVDADPDGPAGQVAAELQRLFDEKYPA